MTAVKDVVEDLVEDTQTSEALRELQMILKKPYKDVCNICKGTGKITKRGACPKCHGSG